jgi:dephospho-CoA kinase
MTKSDSDALFKIPQGVDRPSTMVEFQTFLKSHCIGLTGGIATGKSTVANFLRTKGFLVIDADQLSRQVVEPGEPTFTAIVQRFGPDVLRPEQEGSPRRLDRDKLRQIVLASPSDRKALEALMHPAIQQKFKDTVDQSGVLDRREPIFYEAALIFETGRDSLFHEIWATHCSKTTQIDRLRSRSGLTADAAQGLIDAQMPAMEKSRLATRAIDTDVSLTALQLKIDDLAASLVTRTAHF